MRRRKTNYVYIVTTVRIKDDGKGEHVATHMYYNRYLVIDYLTLMLRKKGEFKFHITKKYRKKHRNLKKT